MIKIVSILVLCVLSISGCANTQSTTPERQDQWVEYYNQQADEWRLDGIDSMADYYEQRLQEEQDNRDRRERGILNLFY